MLGIKLRQQPDTAGGWNQYGLADEGVNQRTVLVDTTGVPTLDFALTAEREQRLFANGKAAAEKFLRQLSPENARS